MRRWRRAVRRGSMWVMPFPLRRQVVGLDEPNDPNFEKLGNADTGIGVVVGMGSQNSSLGTMDDAECNVGPTPIESFEDVFAREHEPMLRLAYLLLGSPAQAEEAVQDAFARLLDRYDSVQHPGAYLRTTTLNRCRDLLRSRDRERSFLGRLAGGLRSDPTDGSPTTGELDDVLAALAPRRREVVVLRYFLGHNNGEIAELLDIPETTVRSTLHRALHDLRGALS